MDRRDQLIRICGDDGAGSEPLSLCRVLPHIPKPRHKHRPAIAERDREGLLVTLTPLVEAAGRHRRPFAHAPLKAGFISTASALALAISARARCMRLRRSGSPGLSLMCSLSRCAIAPDSANASLWLSTRGHRSSAAAIPPMSFQIRHPCHGRDAWPPGSRVRRQTLQNSLRTLTPAPQAGRGPSEDRQECAAYGRKCRSCGADKA